MSTTTPNVDSNSSQYGYQPSLAVGIIGLTLFTLSTIVHTIQMCTSSMWWLVVLILGGITEMIGYSARIYSWTDDTSLDAFLAQTVTLIIGPSFFSAALYVTFSLIISIVGREYSVLGPKWYTITFVIADFISLIIQAVGGGQAAVAARTKSDTSNGTHIMIAGICWQMLSMLVYVALVVVYVIRMAKAKVTLTRNLKIFILGMAIVTSMIFIRCIYRTVELQAGWTGYIITHEVYFVCLDGLPMIIALITFNIFHPSRYLQQQNRIDAANVAPNKNNVTMDERETGSVSDAKL